MRTIGKRFDHDWKVYPTIRSTCNIQLRETQMDDAINNNTLQPSFSGTRKRNASITSDHQADIKRAKKAEYNKRYREKQASLKRDTTKKAEYNKRYREKQASLKKDTSVIKRAKKAEYNKRYREKQASLKDDAPILYRCKCCDKLERG